MKIEDIDFILSHFDHQLELFPRNMMTKRKNYQFTVYDKAEIFERCQESGFIDCRINGYPAYTEWKEIIRHPPNFLFFDLDMGNCNYDRKRLDRNLTNTLKEIGKISGSPTVLWTGNGYHIYQPIEAIVLDQESIFSKDNFPNLFSITGKYSDWSVSEAFFKYAGTFFTHGKSDPQHHPKYKTCLIRIPGSFNSKLIDNGLEKAKSMVKIIQEWNGDRPAIQFLLKDFRRWLVQEEINQRNLNSKRRNTYKNRIGVNNNFQIPWIERLLQTPLEDNRKYSLFHILVPYLVNVKKLSIEKTTVALVLWTSKSNHLRALHFNPEIEIKNRIKYVKNYKPISLAKLKVENIELYKVLVKIHILPESM